MCRVLTIAFWALLASCGPGSAEGWPDSPVESITRYNSRGEKTRLELYDRTGNIQEERSFYSDGTLDNRITYSYDGSGKLLEQFDSSASDRYIYEYDDQGRLVAEINEDLTGRHVTRVSWSADGLIRVDSVARTGYVYIRHLDDAGRTVQWFTLNSDGDTSASSRTTYTAQGEELEYHSEEDGRFFSHRKNVYDGQGRRVEEQLLDADGSVIHRVVNTWGDDGRLLKVERLKPDGKPDFTLRYEYKGLEKYTHSEIPGMKPSTTREVYSFYAAE